MRFRDFFPFEPTPSQLQLIDVFELFFHSKEKKNTLLIRGHAGTGKTHVAGAIVQYFKKSRKATHLMAPTGRAAKVMTNFSKKKSYTIHSQIFTYQYESTTNRYTRQLKKNKATHTCYLIDEASMIDTLNYPKGLLGHLIDFVFADDTNKLVLIGDDAQLPPIGQSEAYSLQANFLFQHFDLNIFETHLTDVTRQSHNSGILFNANFLRKQIEENTTTLQFFTKGFGDIYMIGGHKVEDGLRYSYDKYGVENVIIIARSNWSTVQYNQYVRNSILFFEDEIEAGDLLLVTKNNYTYKLNASQGGFIANGDFLKVESILNFEEMYGYRFATAEMSFVEQEKENVPPFEAKILLDSLNETPEENKKQSFVELRAAIEQDYIANFDNPQEALRLTKEDAYYNALQVKFAYALTTYKAQGGQWKVVFLDPGKLREDEPNNMYLKWLYTGFTRAYKTLYLVNFVETFGLK